MRQWVSAPVLALAAAWGAVAGCTQSEVSRADAPAWGPAEGWRLTEERLRIGGDESRPGHALFEVDGAIALVDGRVAVADGGSTEIRVFDPRGELLAAFGASGDGPAEFRAVGGLWLLPGDTLLVGDPLVGRLTQWSLDGRLHRSTTLEWAPRTDLLGRFDDGTLLAIERPLPIRAAPGSISVDSATAFLMTERSKVGVGRFAHATMYAAARPGGEGGAVLSPLPFASAGVFATARDGFYHGFGDRWAIVRHDVGGVPVDTLDRPGTAVSADDESRRLFVEELVSRPGIAPERRPALRRYWETFPTAEVLPAFDRLLASTDGCLWARHPLLPGRDSVTWTVFWRAGRWLGDRTLSAAVQPLQIEADRALFLDTRADGTEQVVLYAATIAGSSAGCPSP